jgi:site-specific DNA recombinase
LTDNDLRVAIYARVSSEKQAEEGTIASQLEELKQRVASDHLTLCDELCFVDDGYSGATLVRPALEKLRDVVALGGVDRLYVHSPDRLARKYAYQVLLVDEFRRAEVEVQFLNHTLGTTPEEDLLLQVQGVVAEYELAKIMERSRRGKLHAARSGRVSALGGAPYGYRYVTRGEGGGEARYDIVLDEARVVRKIFDWIGKSRLSIGEVVRRLSAERIPSRKGRKYWDRSSLWQILINPAYKGEAAFGKTKTAERRFRLRPMKGHPEQPRNFHTSYDRPRGEWVTIAVPPIVGRDLFDAVAEQLEENRKRARRHKRGARYLLQGLLVCGNCGRAYFGRAIRSGRSAKNRPPRTYSYYLCGGRIREHFAGQRLCENGNVRIEMLDDAVWKDVRSLLASPKRMEEEFQRRMRPDSKEESPIDLRKTHRCVRRRVAGEERV